MLFIGADHRGFQLKEKIKAWLEEWGYEFEDLGNEKLESEDDYNDYALRVADKLMADKGNRGDRGILTCGSGVGMSIAANRVFGVRCGLCTSVEQTVAARKEDDINCLALGAEYLTEGVAKQIVEAFLRTEFVPEERYLRRIAKLK